MNNIPNFTPTYTPSTMPHRNNSIHSMSNNDMLFLYIAILPTVGVITLTLIFCICRKIQQCIQNPIQNPIQNHIQNPIQNPIQNV